ncbi:MAG: anti-sigma factor [Sediminibacterium sp.]|nr:anti-sigma factor [Sediminibacterium sp.]
MDTKAYIESGVIESYVLGMADAQDAAELEQLSRQHPEIRQAIDDFELGLEQAALAGAVAPPADVKRRLLGMLAADFADEAERPAKVIPMTRRFSLASYVAAASIILLVVSAALNFYFYSQVRSTSSAYQALLAEKSSLLAENQLTRTTVLDMYQSMQMMSDPAVTKVAMPGVAGRESSLATVFWDTRSRDVYILPNKLPAAAAGKQYQLWAIVDGKPVDAGVIGACAGLCKMKNIPKASMFAITLENAGGSPTPHLDQMYVAGKVG